MDTALAQWPQRRPDRDIGSPTSKSLKAATPLTDAPTRTRDHITHNDESIPVVSYSGSECNEVGHAHKSLLAFDLDLTFGPCTGLTRSERWLRAYRLGLQPPEEIKNILDEVPTLEASLWSNIV